MRRTAPWSWLAALVLCTAPAASAQQTLYKLIDKSGKVTYSETAPKGFDGQVIPITIDPKANTMAPPKAPPAPPAPAAKAGETQNEKIIRRRVESKWDRLQAARDRVEAARKAYEDLRDNPAEGDMNWVARGAYPAGIEPGKPTQYSPPKPVPQPGIGQPINPVVPGFPQAGGKITGARPVPTQDYLDRLAQAEKALEAAEAELKKVEAETR